MKVTWNLIFFLIFTFIFLPVEISEAYPRPLHIVTEGREYYYAGQEGQYIGKWNANDTIFTKFNFTVTVLNASVSFFRYNVSKINQTGFLTTTVAMEEALNLSTASPQINNVTYSFWNKEFQKIQLDFTFPFFIINKEEDPLFQESTEKFGLNGYMSKGHADTFDSDVGAIQYIIYEIRALNNSIMSLISIWYGGIPKLTEIYPLSSMTYVELLNNTLNTTLYKYYKIQRTDYFPKATPNTQQITNLEYTLLTFSLMLLVLIKRGKMKYYFKDSVNKPLSMQDFF